MVVLDGALVDVAVGYRAHQGWRRDVDGAGVERCHARNAHAIAAPIAITAAEATNRRRTLRSCPWPRATQAAQRVSKSASTATSGAPWNAEVLRTSATGSL